MSRCSGENVGLSDQGAPFRTRSTSRASRGGAPKLHRSQARRAARLVRRPAHETRLKQSDPYTGEFAEMNTRALTAACWPVVAP